MDIKIKRQLILSVVMIGLLLSTLVLWHDNFIFHTYMNTVNYQLCFEGSNDDILVQGYEVYQSDYEQKHGGARIASTKQSLFLKGDKIKLTLQNDQLKEDKQFVHEYTIKDSDEVFYINNEDTIGSFKESDFQSVSLNITIIRQKKEVYNQEISLNSKKLVVYNGGNKDYTLQNIYVSNNWLKTGIFSSTEKDVEKKYPYMTMDYLILKTNGNHDNIDDYERFAHVKGKTQDFLAGKLSQTVIYDGDESLVDKEMSCVITFSHNEKKEDPFTFKIDIYGNIKVGD